MHGENNIKFISANKQNQLIIFVTSKKNYKRPLHPYGLTRSANLNNFNQSIFTSESMEITEEVKTPRTQQ
jgi:hypothetical protein